VKANKKIENIVGSKTKCRTVTADGSHCTHLFTNSFNFCLCTLFRTI